MTVLHWKLPGAGRSARTQNSLKKGVGHGWLFTQLKWADAGAKKLPPSSQPWPGRVLSPIHSFCRAGSKPRGFVGGANACVLCSTGFHSVFARPPTSARHRGRHPVLCTRSCGMHVLASLPVWLP